MRPAFLLAAVAPLAWALPSTFSPRAQTDVQKITASIATIVTDIGILNSTLNTFHKGDLDALPKVLKIMQETTDLGDAIQSATSTAKSSKSLSETDSGTAAVAVLNLEPKIFSLLKNLVAKKPAFDSAVLLVGSVSPQVEKSLKQQKAESDAFGKALTAKLTPDYASLAPTIQKQIDDAFNKAITVYSKSGGVIPI